MLPTRNALTLVAPLLFCFACLFPTSAENEIGAEEAQRIAEQVGLVPDGALVEYVRSVGSRLSADAKREDVEYRFFVADSIEPNAFALPGGFVYITRGLLALVNSEDELAGVLGHEIGHVEARHSVKRLGVASPFAIISGVAGFATGIVSPRLGRAVSGTTDAITQGLVVAPFGRRQEREADSIGLALASGAGYDPVALSHFLDTLGRFVELETGEEESFHFLASHPTTPERVRNTAREAGLAERGEGRAIAGTRRAFLEQLDGLLVGVDPVGGVFEGSRFLHPGLRFGVTFPDGWKTANQPKAVVAAQPDGEAWAAVQIVDEGADPESVVRAINEELEDPIASEMLEVAGLRAARARFERRGSRGPERVDVTWIAYDGYIYQLAGAVQTRVVEKHAAEVRALQDSFEALDDAALRQIHESRLRVAEAQAGESLSSLARRRGSEWSVERAAVVNALGADASLEAGQLLKLSVSEPFRAR